MSYLAHVFEEEDALKNLEKFTSINGANFYNMPINKEFCVLNKHEHPVKFPDKIRVGKEFVTLFNPGFLSNWCTEGTI